MSFRLGVGWSSSEPLRNPTESLILAQDERWRRASNMQVERGLVAGQLAINLSGERVSNTWATCPTDGDTFGKPGLIPGTFLGRHRLGRKGRKTLWDGPAAYQLVGEVTAHQGYDG